MIGLGDIKIGKLKIGSSDVQKVFLGEVQIYPDSSAGGNYKASITVYDGRNTAKYNVECDDTNTFTYSDLQQYFDDIVFQPDEITEIELYGDCIDTIKTISAMTSYPTSAFGVKKITVGEGIKKIDQYAFYNFSGTTDLSLPESIEEIGTYAMYNMQNVKELNLGNNIKSIGSSAFWNMYEITTVNIADSVNSIGSNAFAHCRNLRTITNFPDNIDNIPTGCFQDTGIVNLTLPKTITKINNNGFGGCKSLNTVSLHNGVVSIGEGAFSGCTSLLSFEFPTGITTVSASVLQGCTSLTDVIIPEGVKTLGNTAFDGCTMLRSITLPSTLTQIGQNALRNLKSLEFVEFKSATPPTLMNSPVLTETSCPIYVPCDAVDSYKSKYSFLSDRITCKPTMLRGKFTDDSTSNDWWYQRNGSSSSSDKINISEYVDPITNEFVFVPEISKEASYMFYNNNKLEKIYEVPITENITSIRSMFYNCTGLTLINTSGWNTEKITSIFGTFSNCSSLTSIDLSGCNFEKVNSMNDMFSGCGSLNVLNLSGCNFKNVSSMNYMFSSCNNLTTVIGQIYNIKVNLDLHYSPLTNESAMVFINGLSSEVSGKTLRLSTTTYDTLTPEQLQIASDKGWTVQRG